MFSLEALREINDAADRRAKREGKLPLPVTLLDAREALAEAEAGQVPDAIRGIPVFGDTSTIERLGYDRVDRPDYWCGDDAWFCNKGFERGERGDFGVVDLARAVVEALEAEAAITGNENPVLHLVAHDEGPFQLYCSIWQKRSGAEPPEDWGEADTCDKCGDELDDDGECWSCTHCGECGDYLSNGEELERGLCARCRPDDELDDDDLAQRALDRF